MQKIVINFALIIGCLLAGYSLQAQDAQAVVFDLVQLKDGKTFRGEIVNLSETGSVELKLTSGEIITISDKQIKKVYQASVQGGKVEVLKPSVYEFKEEGLYGTLSGAFIFGNNGNRLNNRNGYAFDVTGGHMFNRWVGIGLHTGYRNYASETDENFIPVGMEVIGYLTSTRVAPFYSIKSGYGIAIDPGGDENSAEGGFYVEPTIGIRIGSSSGINAMVGFGYSYQKATYDFPRIDPWIWGGEGNMINQRVEYNRWTLRVGMTF